MAVLSDEEDTTWYSTTDDDDFDSRPAHVTVTDPEEWTDYHSEFLVTLYHQLQDKVAEMGVPVLDRCTFHDFATFCHSFSSGHKPPC